MTTLGKPIKTDYVSERPFDLANHKARTALQMARKYGHRHFSRHIEAAHQQSATVIAFQDYPQDALVDSLDRPNDRHIPLSARTLYKSRAICSQAQMVIPKMEEKEDPMIIKTIVTSVVAPNLRTTDKYGNPIEANHYVDKPIFSRNSKLNQKRYRKDMMRMWKLAIHATNLQAKKSGDAVMLFCPLIGLGAYLEGQPQSVCSDALQIFVTTLIEAYQTMKPEFICGIHLCAPIDTSNLAFSTKFCNESTSLLKLVF